MFYNAAKTTLGPGYVNIPPHLSFCVVWSRDMTSASASFWRAPLPSGMAVEPHSDHGYNQQLPEHSDPMSYLPLWLVPAETARPLETSWSVEMIQSTLSVVALATGQVCLSDCSTPWYNTMSCVFCALSPNHGLHLPTHIPPTLSHLCNGLLQ